MKPLTVSSCAFFAQADIRANADTISRAINDAANQGAQLLLTPECALIGYPGQGREDLDEIDWRAVASLEDQLAEQAVERGLILVLGTANPSGSGLTNDALVCGAIEEEQRYRKRCLTPFDATQFVPGRNQILFSCHGWKVGLTICYEVRFPSLWADLARAGADCFVHIAHMGGPEPDPPVKNTVIPQHYASRAAEWATPLVACNTSAPDRWLDSGFWDPRGMLTESCGEGLMSVQVHPRSAYHPFYSKIHENALEALDLRIGHEALI